MVLNKLFPGMTVYSVKKSTGRSTFISKWQTWTVHIKEIDTVNNKVLASWSGNKPEWFNENSWSKWRIKRPEN